tara:strand:- start:579 stop:1541 length:963 start_codon:yes stop_codon:yes gene_type:complete
MKLSVNKTIFTIQSIFYAIELAAPIYLVSLLNIAVRFKYTIFFGAMWCVSALYHATNGGSPTRYDMFIVLNSIVVTSLIFKSKFYQSIHLVSTWILTILTLNFLFGVFVYSRRFYFTINGIHIGGNGILMDGNIFFYTLGYAVIIYFQTRRVRGGLLNLIFLLGSFSKGLVIALLLNFSRLGNTSKIILFSSFAISFVLLNHLIPDARKNLSAGRFERIVDLPDSIFEVFFGQGYYNYENTPHYETALDIYQYMGILGVLFIVPWMILLIKMWKNKSNLFYPFLFLILYGTFAGHVFEEAFASFILISLTVVKKNDGASA